MARAPGDPFDLLQRVSVVPKYTPVYLRVHIFEEHRYRYRETNRSQTPAELRYSSIKIRR